MVAEHDDAWVSRYWIGFWQFDCSPIPPIVSLGHLILRRPLLT